MKLYSIRTLMASVVGTLLLFVYACAPSAPMVQAPFTAPSVSMLENVNPPSPDPRVGLGAGLFDAEEAIWNLEMLSQTPPAPDFVGVTNSDLAFKGTYAFQGNYNGVMIWDLSDPSAPVLVKDYLCPASQSDVSVYGDLLFVSGEGSSGRLDCGTQGVQQAVSKDRLRGIRIFDITNIEDPQYIANVQTCRGSHTHSVLKDPEDDENVYIYVSGSAGVRPSEELAGCSDLRPGEDPNSALFRIEVIKVPLDSPENSAIVSSPRIFEDLEEPPTHGLAPADIAAMEEAIANGAFTYMRNGTERVMSGGFARRVLAGIAEERGNETPTSADTLFLRENATSILENMFGWGQEDPIARRGPNQCHDITLYPEIGLAGGACEGYGLLLDITDPVNPVRIDAVADSNFSYWHSATFTNDGSKVLFTDEWGGGGQPKCRESDPMEWGANAIFTIEDGKLIFEEYYKLPAAQTVQENCVAHNGSMIPVPGRDIMVQSWYQGGISIFDWTDPNNPVEIAFHDRGPVSPERMQMGGSWSVYWYNGLIVSSEIARGLDIFDLKPSPYLTENEIAASKTVKLDYLNAQGHPMFVWPTTTALAKAYVDQLDRDKGLDAASLTAVRQGLANADVSDSKAKSKILSQLAEEVSEMSNMAKDSEKVSKLANTLKDLASM
ncbi:MAG: hypothetical protein RLN90_03255 [Balneolaceae bacterium]